MHIPTIEAHYIENYQKLAKRMGFRAGTQWDGEDVVQEAYARALKYHKSFNGDNFDRWFSTVLNNTLKEHKNMMKGHTTVEYEEDEAEGTDCTLYPRRVMKEVFELIDTKSVVQMEVLKLFFEQEYTAKDISKITPYSYAMTHQIIQRFRNELRDLYG